MGVLSSQNRVFLLEGARISGVGVGGCVLEMEVVPKVSGFDLSRIMREGATHHSTHTMGTITHQAPSAGGTVGWYRGGNMCVPKQVLVFQAEDSV